MSARSRSPARRAATPCWPSAPTAPPERLALKFKELPEDERDLLVLAGTLHDFDVGAAPMPAFYGALPATVFPSPGAAVRASVLWVSDVQLTALAWSELSYWLGRLDGVRFEPRRRARAGDHRPARLRLALGRAVRR